jgi:hypothetical protein
VFALLRGFRPAPSLLAVAEEARRLGFKVLMGFTELDVVMERAQRRGFEYQGKFHLISLPL